VFFCPVLNININLPINKIRIFKKLSLLKMTIKNSDQVQVAFTVAFSICIPIAIIFKLICARIFTNIEFRTENFRFLKYYSIIDAISFFILLPMPLIVCQDLFMVWLKNNYYLVFYQLYVVSFIWSSLNTFKSILSLSVAWNHLRNLKSHKTSTKLFYLVICFSAIFSILLHAPNLVINEISVKLNITRETYFLQQTSYNKYIIFEYSIVFSILFLTLVFNTTHISIIVIDKTLQYKSVINSNSKSKIRLASIASFSNQKRISSVKEEDSPKVVLTNLIVLADLSYQRNSSIVDNCLRRSLKLSHTKSKYLFIGILFIFLFDLFLKSMVGFTTILRIENSNSIQIILIFSVLLTQIFHFLIYFKLSDPFLIRFKTFYKKLPERPVIL
jgi:hypothetical protein